MGLLTRKTDNNPLSKNIDDLLDGMNQEKEEAKEGEYVFQELETLDTGDKRIEQFIIYRWNRVYPADVSVEIGTEWKLTKTEEFPGFSHEKITKEIYCRE